MVLERPVHQSYVVLRTGPLSTRYFESLKSLKTQEAPRATWVSLGPNPFFLMHAFIKTLCDLHVSPFKPCLCHQFSISYDLYLRIRAGTDQRVQIALKRNTPDWKLWHTCPPCTYELEDEPKLKFCMLYTVNRNDSLKRIIRHEDPPLVTRIEEEMPAHPILNPLKELTYTREIGTGLYLTNEQVDKLSKETLATLFPAYKEEETDDIPCAEWWRNMKTTLTVKMWGVFQETGLFLALSGMALCLC